jgi:enamine deaminase RidA (YjgF/YER057c/UK114 family)
VPACQPFRHARPDRTGITAKEPDVRKPESYDAGFSHQIGRYSDAIRVPAGQEHDQIIISGTPGLDKKGAIPADFADEARHASQNIRAILAKAGASVRDSVSVRQYLTRPEDIKAYVELREEMIAHEPAARLSVVGALAWPSIHVELEVVAPAPAKASPRTRTARQEVTQ